MVDFYSFSADKEESRCLGKILFFFFFFSKWKFSKCNCNGVCIHLFLSYFYFIFFFLKLKQQTIVFVYRRWESAEVKIKKCTSVNNKKKIITSCWPPPFTQKNSFFNMVLIIFFFICISYILVSWILPTKIMGMFSCPFKGIQNINFLLEFEINWMYILKSYMI